MTDTSRPGTVGDLIVALTQLDPSTQVWYFSEHRLQYEQSIVDQNNPFIFNVRRFKTGSDILDEGKALAEENEESINVIVL